MVVSIKKEQGDRMCFKDIFNNKYIVVSEYGKSINS